MLFQQYPVHVHLHCSDESCQENLESSPDCFQHCCEHVQCTCTLCMCDVPDLFLQIIIDIVIQSIIDIYIVHAHCTFLVNYFESHDS